MKPLIVCILVLIPLIALADIPAENVTKGDRPDVAGATECAVALLEALKSNPPGLAKGAFFPADAFDRVKDMPVPARYYKKLVRWFHEDIAKESKRFRKGAWVFDNIELGLCKWKEAGTEGNKVPYWSCRRNRVTVREGDRIRRFEIEVLINWGPRWYVTHLGPIR